MRSWVKFKVYAGFWAYSVYSEFRVSSGFRVCFRVFSVYSAFRVYPVSIEISRKAQSASNKILLVAGVPFFL